MAVEATVDRAPSKGQGTIHQHNDSCRTDVLGIHLGTLQSVEIPASVCGRWQKIPGCSWIARVWRCHRSVYSYATRWTTMEGGFAESIAHMSGDDERGMEGLRPNARASAAALISRDEMWA